MAGSISAGLGTTYGFGDEARQKNMTESNMNTLLAEPVLKRRSHLPISEDLQLLPPLLARLYADRGIVTRAQVGYELTQLIAPAQMRGLDAAARLLIAAKEAQKRIVIVGDFDADGATSTAVAILGLRGLGLLNIDFLVPNRFLYGYGLTVPIVDEAHALGAELIITVDNGIASFEGVARARDLGLQVLVTDHHLAAEHLPNADVIVNPNVPGCDFPSKALAGVGVMFYVLLALRSALRERGDSAAQFNLATLLDVVALGTIADVVPLDDNNRILVQQGLRRVRAGHTRPGILALLRLAKRDLKTLTATDLAFTVAPRLNSAGRLDDMRLGIQCLLAEDARSADAFALQLDNLNQERKQIEEGMLADADEIIHRHLLDQNALPAGLCLYDEQWHQGVIGLIAGRIKERVHRPTICFAPAGNDEIKGSARSIPGVHIRDVLADIANHQPQLLTKFGGHAMAAGMSLHRANLPAFRLAFRDTVLRVLGGELPSMTLCSDGELSASEISLSNACLLRDAGPWGQQFPEPMFDGEFEIERAQCLSERHQRLQLRKDGISYAAILFDAGKRGWREGQSQIRILYKLNVNSWREQDSVQLMIERVFL